MDDLTEEQITDPAWLDVAMRQVMDFYRVPREHEEHLAWLAWLEPVAGPLIGPRVENGGHFDYPVVWMLRDSYGQVWGLALELCTCVPLSIALEEQVQSVERWVTVGGIRWIRRGKDERAGDSGHLPDD